MASNRTEEGQPEPEVPPPRRFLILDAMALVLAAAFMLSAPGALLRLRAHDNMFLNFGGRSVSPYSAALAVLGLSFALLPFILARPGDRRRLRQGARGSSSTW